MLVSVMAGLSWQLRQALMTEQLMTQLMKAPMKPLTKQQTKQLEPGLKRPETVHWQCPQTDLRPQK